MEEIIKNLKEIDEDLEISEKIDPSMTREEIIKEIMDSWEKKGTIHGSKVDSKEDALKRAEAIAYSVHPSK